MELKVVKIEKPEDTNFILGQSHFIKTVEDIHEAIVQTNPQMKFGLGFCESSGMALVRWTGNDDTLIEMAKKNAMSLSCGHCFILFMENGFPINILNNIKNSRSVHYFLRYSKSSGSHYRRNRTRPRYSRYNRRD